MRLRYALRHLYSAVARLLTMPQAKSNDEMNSWLAAILDASELPPADKEVMKAEAHIVAAVGDDHAPGSPPGPRVRL